MPLHPRPRRIDPRQALRAAVLVLIASTVSVGALAATDRGGEAGTAVLERQTPTAEPAGSGRPGRPGRPAPETVATEIAGIRVSSADGYIVDRQAPSPFDESVPAIAKLDPDLRAALQQASTDASAEGITMTVNSGWRSETYQQALLDAAIVQYGSEDEARKWVQTPEESHHVTGDAVDIGPVEADTWLIEHGADYGLCQTYANENWHFELMTEPGGTCPPPISDATAG
ncbi:MAG TPA: M15 family metallopeptidase [Thermomicrobiales bacterium]|nr:M15 family metallopeptidase [Thermomicrobiales bacterium]